MKKIITLLLLMAMSVFAFADLAIDSITVHQGYNYIWYEIFIDSTADSTVGTFYFRQSSTFVGSPLYLVATDSIPFVSLTIPDSLGPYYYSDSTLIQYAGRITSLKAQGDTLIDTTATLNFAISIELDSLFTNIYGRVRAIFDSTSAMDSLFIKAVLLGSRDNNNYSRYDSLIAGISCPDSIWGIFAPADFKSFVTGDSFYFKIELTINDTINDTSFVDTSLATAVKVDSYYPPGLILLSGSVRDNGAFDGWAVNTDEYAEYHLIFAYDDDGDVSGNYSRWIDYRPWNYMKVWARLFGVPSSQPCTTVVRIETLWPDSILAYLDTLITPDLDTVTVSTKRYQLWPNGIAPNDTTIWELLDGLGDRLRIDINLADTSATTHKKLYTRYGHIELQFKK